MQNGFSQRGCINGFIRDRNELLPMPGVYIIMSEPKVTVISNKIGFFEVCNLKPGEYSFRLSYIGYKDTTISKINIKDDQISKLEICLSECKFYTLGHSDICPACGKKDLVVKILYGSVSTKMIKNAKKGKVYLGGMKTGCDPLYYCKRDSTKF
jgi:hypothetical protein